MTESERREQARQFIQKWHRKGREDEDDRSYWLDILQRILGMDNATDRIDFQKKDIVYNNFPWPECNEKQKAEIEKTAQMILDARKLYPNDTLADLYDPLTMPPELLAAHRANDKAVMQAYGLDIKTTKTKYLTI